MVGGPSWWVGRRELLSRMVKARKQINAQALKKLRQRAIDVYRSAPDETIRLSLCADFLGYLQYLNCFQNNRQPITSSKSA